MASGIVSRVLVGHTGWASCLVVLPDGKLAMGAGLCGSSMFFMTTRAECLYGSTMRIL